MQLREATLMLNQYQWYLHYGSCLELNRTRYNSFATDCKVRRNYNQHNICSADNPRLRTYADSLFILIKRYIYHELKWNF